MPYWLIIAIGLSLLIALYWSWLESNWNYMFASIPFFIAIMMCIGLPMSGIKADNPHYSLRYTETTQIYSLRTNELISGSFSLGCGSINDESYYIYYTQDSDGAYSINRLKASECKIYMDRDSGGQLVKVWGKLNDENLHKNWGWMEVIFSHNEFHLPHGSLIQEYSVR